MLISVTTDTQLTYPDPATRFSPDQPYPEYRHEHLAGAPNAVYAAVRATLAQAGLDREHYGTSAWNPLGAWIRQGDRVFLLCNFVYHQRAGESAEAFHAKCTHGSVLRALADYVLIAAGPTGCVRFGNAPVQSCDWDGVQEATGAAHVSRFYEERGLDVAARDLRGFVSAFDAMGRELWTRTSDTQASVEIDLGRDSLLAPLDAAGAEPQFRVADYDPARTMSFHSGASHRYVVSREILDADVVISIPKLKTHAKVGITCGLKGFVGAITQKDCLAHHRVGSADRGGDEYPAHHPVRQSLSAFAEWVQARRGRSPLLQALRVLDRSSRRFMTLTGAIQEGGWHGNDTAWRMALDIARIVHWFDRDGNACAVPPRRNLMLLDGIVAGEGNGPLSPSPVRAGALLFADNVAAGDGAACMLMGFDPSRIPLVREALRRMRYPLQDGAADTSVFVNGAAAALAQLTPAPRAFRAPAGWRDHLRVAGAA